MSLRVSSDDKNWVDISNGPFYPHYVGSHYSIAEASIHFDSVRGRYVRLEVKAWHSHPSMRAGVYVYEEAFFLFAASFLLSLLDFELCIGAKQNPELFCLHGT